jgi:hypothetical protein
MKRPVVERNIVILLFIAVLTVFSLAERDSKRLDKLYTSTIKKGTNLLLAKMAKTSKED